MSLLKKKYMYVHVKTKYYMLFVETDLSGYASIMIKIYSIHAGHKTHPVYSKYLDAPDIVGFFRHGSSNVFAFCTMSMISETHNLRSSTKSRRYAGYTVSDYGKQAVSQKAHDVGATS